MNSPPPTPPSPELAGAPSGHTPMGMLGFLRAVAPYFAPHKPTAALIVLTMLVDLAYATVVPLLFQAIIDDAIVPHSVERLYTLLGALAGGAVVATTSGFVQDVAYARAGVAVMNAMRLRLFSHVQDLSAEYHARTQIGDIMSRFSSDIAAVENALVWYLPAVLLGAGGIAISCLLLFRIEWRLAALSIVGLFVAFAISHRIEPRANKLTYQLKEELGSLSVVVEENLHAHAVVRGFGLQAQQRGHFQKRLDTLLHLSRRASFIGFFMARIPNVGALLVGFATLGIGAYLVFAGTMKLGELVAFYTLFNHVSLSVTQLTYSMPSLLEGAAGMERVEELLRERPTVKDGPDAKPLSPLAHAIELDAVTFGYTEGARNLDGVSLAIKKGHSVAFVGASGSGKSTVLNLVQRSYDPQQGAVRYDGRDIREITRGALRSQLGIVFQDCILFDTTIRENIALGRPGGASDQEVVAAAKQAEIHDFIESLPDGYDTAVGDGGSRLSGGQRQRVAIARALVRSPSVLVLDEATSALDAHTESLVDRTIQKLAGQLTVLAVTHRLASVIHYDRIFVMEHGKLVEEGKHDELLARGGVYARLFAKQQGFAIDDDDRASVSAERLAKVPLFAKLDGATLERIAAQMTSASADAGSVLVREGDKGSEFFIVARGRLEVTKRGPDGREERVEVFEEGDTFGEISLLRNVPRTATVKTLTPTTYLTMQREHFLHLVDGAGSPEMREALDLAIEARLRENASVAAGGQGVV